MGRSVNARITPQLEQKLAEYCAKRGVTRSEAVVQALDRHLDAASGGISAWALAADLVPDEGVKEIQADNARALARKAMRGPRAR
jgi:hypothetical protein